MWRRTYFLWLEQMQNYCSEARYLPEKGQLEYYSNKPLLLQGNYKVQGIITRYITKYKVLLQGAPIREYKN